VLPRRFFRRFQGLLEHGMGQFLKIVDDLPFGPAEALVTTAIGLLVAIPAVMMFNYLTGRVEAFDVEMDNSSSELIDYFLKKRGDVRR
jgi:hypothetical protein